MWLGGQKSEISRDLTLGLRIGSRLEALNLASWQIVITTYQKSAHPRVCGRVWEERQGRWIPSKSKAIPHSTTPRQEGLTQEPQGKILTDTNS